MPDTNSLPERVHTRLRRSAGTALAAMAAVLSMTACGSSPGVSAPAGLPQFYSVPPGVSGKSPGTLLKWEPVATPGLRGQAYRVMYVSRDVGGAPAAVTGLVLVPRTPAPAGGYPVLSWAHGTNGLADQCAPSLHPASALPSLGALNAVLDLGWEFVATDYQGEGTPPGLLPYLVGETAARDAIDIVRAARAVPGADPSYDYAVWGYSEGGQTAMFAWHLGPGYGSRGGLHLVAVVAGAPPSHLATAFEHLASGPDRVYLYSALVGFNVAYGDRRAPLDLVLTATGRNLVPEMAKGCLNYDAAAVDRYSPAELFKADPATLRAWRSLLAANDPARFTSANDIPLLLVQGGSDTVVEPASTDLLARDLCRAGQPLQEWVYPGQGHGGALVVSVEDTARWIAGEFESANPDSYVPTGEAGIVRTVCPG